MASSGKSILQTLFIEASASPLSRSPKIAAPSLNASTIVSAAPPTSGFASCQARMSSSDRKKLIVVQSDVHARRSSAARLPTQTITFAAAASGPEGSTASASASPQWWHGERISIR